ncbi:MAG: sigma-70 family RNA polymerase sigma factor [Oscillospiraceae bacterium]|jgi:RNA polymerase sigma-70 factor (ECF subfamily)|nr:sigma-70 family RNA polymerase sigma factor [Oscillospiraceae bacterium]
MDDGDLRGIRRRDTRALERVIKRYAGYVGAVARNILGARMTAADIEEVCSDVFLALWNSAGAAEDTRLRPYLAGIARNIARNKLRELVGDLPLEDDDILIADMNPEDEAIRRDRDERVRRAVDALRAPDREIFLRHYYHCQTVARIAEDMRMNPETVKSRLSRGREKLRRALNEGGKIHDSKDF